MTKLTCNFSPFFQAKSCLQAIPQTHSTSGSLKDSTGRRYMAGMACLMGLGLFFAMQMPTSTAIQPFLEATHGMESDVHQLDSQPGFHPAADLGLPSRREPGGTR